MALNKSMSELVAVKSGSLPHEIVEEIICRLPVKALHRFRCVASSFNSSVSEYRLARKHLSYATKRENTHFLLYDLPSKWEKHIRVCPLSSIPGRAQEDSRDLVIKLPDNGAAHCVAFMNSYSGLLCFGDDQSIFVYNLSSGTCTRVPESPNPRAYFNKSSMGIGYDSTKDEYIIIKLVLRTSTEVWMYSSKGKSWQRVGDFPWNICPYGCIFATGQFHWMAFVLASDLSPAVVSFDPTSRVFKITRVPKPVRGGASSLFYLINLHEKLCVFNEKSGTIWETPLSEEANGSWVQVSSLSQELIRSKPRSHQVTVRFLRPLYLYESGEVLAMAVFEERTELLICHCFVQRSYYRYYLILGAWHGPRRIHIVLKMSNYRVVFYKLQPLIQS